MSAEVADVLRGALALIEDEGNWVRYAYATEDERFCAVGALRRAAQFALGVPNPTYVAAYDALRVSAEIGPCAVSSFNDAPERTHAEVVAAFKAAIVAEEWSE